jgi:hypothetical protein
MKPLISLFIAGLAILPPPVYAAETAQAKLWCLSLRFQSGLDQNAEYSLDFTMLSIGINGELAPDFGGSYTHFSYLELTDEWFGDTMPGALSLDVPYVGDANGNGWNDFFEVSQPVNATSSGIYNITGVGSGAIQVSWARSAGSHVGMCVLKFKPNPDFTWATFTHTFELIEYGGPVNYTPGSNGVSGTVALTQTDGAGDQFTGPFMFTKVSTNRFNELILQPGAWTNSALQTLTYMADPYQRDSSWPTNYYGYFDFDDGDLNTAEPDYYTWVLSIDDANDANQNGIPDFSDDPLPPRRPQLTLSVTGGALLLGISGEVGRTHQVQSALSVDATIWQTVTAVTLTNDPQIVSLPLPTSWLRFWRVRVQ